MNPQIRPEALRLKETAEKLMAREDYMSARDKLIQARKLSPSLDHIDSMLAVADVLSAASIDFPGCKVDHYWVLQLRPSASGPDLRARSQRLVSLLQPVRKLFPGAEMALQLVKSAFVALSDKDKRAAFDVKRVESWDSYGDMYCKEFFDEGVNKESVTVVSAQSSSKRVSASEGSDGSDGAKKARHSDDTLGDDHCRECRLATDSTRSPEEVEAKRNRSSFYDFDSNRKEEDFQVGQIWAAHHREKFPQRYARINSKSSAELGVTWLRPVPIMEDERRWCEAGFSVASGKFELDPDMSEEKISGVKVLSQMCSWVPGVTEDQFEIYPKAGEVWAVYEEWDLAEWSFNFEIMKGCKFGIVELLTDYSKYVGAQVVYLVKVDGFTSIFRREVVEGKSTEFCIPPNNLYMFSHNIPAYRFKGGEIDRVEDGMYELDPLALLDYVVEVNPIEDPGPSNISSVTDAVDYIPPVRPLSNTQSLKLNWCRTDFTVGQVWAINSGVDLMPRRYAVINSVISNSHVRVAVLDPHPVLDYEVNWHKENLPIVCGVFRVGKTVLNLEMSWCSHSVKCQRSKNQLYYRIYPMKGEVWAMYTNWNKKWKQADFNDYQYRVVEILEDFSEGNGTRVARLIEVKGCMTFFHRHRLDGFDLIRAISKAELLSFSHRIPAFKVPGIERYNIPENSLHLEPDALPPKCRK